MTPITLLLIISLLFTSFVFLASDGVFARHYFLDKDGYHYYVTSERFVAFEGSRELRFYKERPIVLFVKERLIVDEAEIKAQGIDPAKPAQDLWDLYRR